MSQWKARPCRQSDHSWRAHNIVEQTEKMALASKQITAKPASRRLMRSGPEAALSTA